MAARRTKSRGRVRAPRGAGLRARVQRTVPAGARAAFDGWANARSVGTWFTTKARQDVRVGGTYRNADGDRGTYLVVEPPRRLRFTWDNPGHAPGTVVEVTFAAKGPRRTVVRITHSGLASAADARGMRTGWTWALASFRNWVETGRGVRYATWEAART